MNDRDLVQEFLSRCVDDNVDSYKLFITELMRQVSIDSVASVLSIIDGVGYTELNEDLVLSDEHGNSLQGDLSDIFLEKCK